MKIAINREDIREKNPETLWVWITVRLHNKMITACIKGHYCCNNAVPKGLFYSAGLKLVTKPKWKAKSCVSDLYYCEILKINPKILQKF